MRLSVVIPTYNRVDLLLNTLRSVRCQSRSADEIIVVDDGSTDRTREIVAAIEPHVTYLWQRNEGQGSARRTGTLAATGDAICFLDSDDLLMPDALRALEEALVKNPDAVLAVGACELVSADGAPAGLCPLNDVDMSEPSLALRLIRENVIRTPGSVLVRRSRLLEAGDWDGHRKLRGNEDWDLWIRLLDIGPFEQISDVVLQYRLHSHSTSSSRSRMLSAMLFLYRKHYRKKNDLPERHAIIDETLKHMSRRALESLCGDADIEAGYTRSFAIEILYQMPWRFVVPFLQRLRAVLRALMKARPTT